MDEFDYQSQPSPSSAVTPPSAPVFRVPDATGNFPLEAPGVETLNPAGGVLEGQSAPVGRSEDEEGARRMYEHCASLLPYNVPPWVQMTGGPPALPGPSKLWWTAAYRFAFAAGSASVLANLPVAPSSVDRERVRECIDALEWQIARLTNTQMERRLTGVVAKLKGLCDAE